MKTKYGLKLGSARGIPHKILCKKTSSREKLLRGADLQGLNEKLFPRKSHWFLNVPQKWISLICYSYQSMSPIYNREESLYEMFKKPFKDCNN